eukprot:gene27930-34716_t
MSTSAPVLGGVDLVNYFSYKNSDGTYDETKGGIAGSISYSAIYKDYKFYFSTAANKAAFNKAPDTYIPKYGGFCAYGVTAKNCPDNSWSSTCLGPTGNWNYWTISDGSLYIFSSEHAKDSFLDNQSEVQVNGDAKWAGWYGESGSASEKLSMNTQCYSGGSTTTTTATVTTSSTTTSSSAVSSGKTSSTASSTTGKFASTGK